MTQTTATRKAIAYLRCSTHEQEMSGLGLEAQRKVIEAYAALHGIEIVEWYQDVQSGRKENRSGLKLSLIHI